MCVCAGAEFDPAVCAGVLYVPPCPPSGGGVVVSHTADVLVRRRAGEGVCPMEVRVAIIGNVDSGKSTLVGVLTRSMLDDGRGLARGKVRQALTST